MIAATAHRNACASLQAAAGIGILTRYLMVLDPARAYLDCEPVAHRMTVPRRVFGPESQ